MEITPVIQIFAFAVFALIAVAGALGMATTMSMFRSGIFLMASFIGVAGLFILLLADLLALLQVMMYIGGMLVMILFMVLFSNDPGGAMMTSMMELPLIEKFFSLGLTHGDKKNMKDGGDMKQDESDSEMKMPEGGEKQDSQAKRQSENDEIAEKQTSHKGHGNHEQKHGEHENHSRNNNDGNQQNDENNQKKAHENSENQHGKSHGEHGKGGDQQGEKDGGTGDMQMGGMDMEGMSMTTPIKKQAAMLAILVGLFLGGLILLRPAWKVTNSLPNQNSAEQIGNILMGKYMIAFEGSGLLILLGIFGSVMVSRPAKHPDSGERDVIKAAVDEKPAPVETDALEPFYEIDLPTEEDQYEQVKENKKKEEKDKKDQAKENGKKSNKSEKKEAEK